MINKKKTEFEKSLSELKFQGDEAADKFKKDMETQTKRLEDAEKELKDQINQLKIAESQSENKYKQKSGELKSLQKKIYLNYKQKKIIWINNLINYKQV